MRKFLIFDFVVVLNLMICLCLIKNSSGQLTFQSDSNSNSFSLKAPGVQQFFTRTFGSKNPTNANANNNIQSTIPTATTTATAGIQPATTTAPTVTNYAIETPLTQTTFAPTAYSSFPQLQQVSKECRKKKTIL